MPLIQPCSNPPALSPMARKTTSQPSAEDSTGSTAASTTKQTRDKPAQGSDDANGSVAESLSFREAQAALELSLAQLQSSDLDVEAMADLYQRAESYVERCEQLLNAVEQDVRQWDCQAENDTPQPLQP